MQEPDYVDIEVFVGVDIAKGDHYACVVTSAGAEVLARSVRNDEAAIGRLIDDAAVHGTVALVIDTTSSAASLLLETAARREVPARPRRPRLLPAQTLTRQTPQRRRDLRRPTPLQHHPRHAQNPNPLPRTPTPTPAPSRLERLDNKTGTPPALLEPYVTVSRHTAPTVRRWVEATRCQ